MTSNHCSFLGGSALYQLRVIAFLLAMSRILIRYLSCLWTVPSIFPRYMTVQLFGISKPVISFIILFTSSQKGLILEQLQKTWVWLASWLPQSLQHGWGVRSCLLFIWGVTKNLVRFFQPDNHLLWHSSISQSIFIYKALFMHKMKHKVLNIQVNKQVRVRNNIIKILQ